MSRFALIIASISFLAFFQVKGQKSLPRDNNGNVFYQNELQVDVRCKKKIKKRILAHLNQKQEFPSMVFNVIEESADSISFRAITEVPSAKKIHPISFNGSFKISKKTVAFTAGNFQFEDINLSLKDWLKKFENSENQRHQKNVELITSGLDSHIFLTTQNIVKTINQNKSSEQ